MRAVKDGWHSVDRYDVWVEDGKVLRGVKRTLSDDGSGTLYPYRWMGKPYNCFTNASGISLSALRSGLKRGSIIMR